MLRTLKGDRQLADQIIGEVEDSLWLAEEVERRVAEARAEADRWRGAALMGLAGESRERDRAEVVENCLAVVLLHVRLARYVAAKGFVVTVLDRALAVGVASEERGPK